MSMYNHARSRARVLRDERAFQSHVLMHAELLTAHVPELIVQLALVVVVFMVMGYVASVYLRALTHVSWSLWHAGAADVLGNAHVPVHSARHAPGLA